MIYAFTDYELKQMLQSSVGHLDLELKVISGLTVGAAVISAARCVTPVAWLCLGLQ